MNAEQVVFRYAKDLNDHAISQLLLLSVGLARVEREAQSSSLVYGKHILRGSFYILSGAKEVGRKGIEARRQVLQK